jgi:hypothetical protein
LEEDNEGEGWLDKDETTKLPSIRKGKEKINICFLIETF